MTHDKYSKIPNSWIGLGSNRTVVNCSILSKISNIRTTLRYLEFLKKTDASDTTSFARYNFLTYLLT